MAPGPTFDYVWLLALGVVGVSIALSYATTVAVRRWSSVRDFAIEVGPYSLFAAAFGLSLLTALLGGLLLSVVQEVTRGLGPASILGVLLAVYGGPLLAGGVLFGRFVSSCVSTSIEMDRFPQRVVAETGLLFVGFQLGIFPSIWVVALIAS